VYGYADDVRIIGRELIDTVAQARSLGVREDSQESLPKEEKVIEEAPSDSLALLKQELIESRIKLLEEKLAALEDRILNINKEVAYLQKKRDEKDEIIIKLFRMMKKNMDRQISNVAAQLQEHGADYIEVVSRKTSKKKPLILLKPNKPQEPDPKPSE
jgi:uncharacterized coiled-coil protein SlyX